MIATAGYRSPAPAPFPFAPPRCAAPAVGTAETPFQRSFSVAWTPLPSLRLPRLPWRRRCSDKLRVSEPLANNAPCCALKPPAVISLAGIVPEGLFVQVAEQMERLDVNVGALDGALQETPKVLNPVRMNLAVNVPFGMVDDPMYVVVSEVIVRPQRVSVDLRARDNVLSNVGAERTTLTVINGGGSDCAVTVWPVALQEPPGRQPCRLRLYRGYELPAWPCA